MSASTSVPVQYQTEAGQDISNLVVAMGMGVEQFPCGKALIDNGIHHTARLIGNRVYCPQCETLIAKNGKPVLISTDYPVGQNEGITCGDAIALPKPANWNGPSYPGYGANVARLTAAAKYCARQGDAYLPPSKQGQEDEPTSFFRQRLGINDNLIRDHAPTTPEPRTPARKPTPPIAQSVTHPTAIDWETQYHMAEANYILIKAENDRLRQRLTDLGFTVTGKPGLAQITR